MLKFVAMTMVLASLVGCVTKRGSCDLAPEREGWRHLQKRPEIVVENEEADAGRYVAWFQKNSEIYLRCERHKSHTGCGEIATFYSVKSGQKLEGMEELIVCSRD